MDFVLFTKALVVGFAIAAPVGPIGLICIQQTLSYGAKSGFVTGLGAATADAVYGAIGAFGLTALTQALTAASKPMTLFGVVFLSWMGIRFLLPQKKQSAVKDSSTRNLLRSFISTFLLTIANPITILSFVAVFASISSSIKLNTASAGTIVLVVFLGSIIWWVTLVGGVSLVRHKIGASGIQWISRTAGMFLLGFAGWQLTVII